MKKADHTPGLMKHYTAPLRPQYPTIVHELQMHDGTVIVKWGGFDGLDLPKKQIAANARRLAACWNACMGISTAELERGAPVTRGDKVT